MKLSTAFVFLLLIALAQCSSVIIANVFKGQKTIEYNDTDTIGQIKAKFMIEKYPKVPASQYSNYYLYVPKLNIEDNRTVKSYNFPENKVLVLMQKQ